LGLKDCNDELASKTFTSLSIMVKLLGSEVVIGSSFKNDKNEKIRHFSNNLPKVYKNLKKLNFQLIFILFKACNKWN
jgi:hypothetical protein